MVSLTWSHGFSSRRCPSLSSRRCSVSIWSAARDRDAHRGDGAERARAPAALQHRALAEDRTGPELGERFAVDLDRQHAVEQQVELRAELALLDEHVTVLDLAHGRLLAAAHDRGGEIPLERGFHRGDERGRVLVAPRRVLAECVAVPVLEVGEAGLRRELARVVVDPVTGERARARHREFAASVRVHDHFERRPHERRLELHERRMVDATGGRERGAAADRLHEASGRAFDLRGPLDVGQARRGEGGFLRREPHGRSAHRPATVVGVTRTDDPAIFHFDPSAQHVREPEPVGGLELGEVLDHIRRRRVVVCDTTFEDGFVHPVTASEGIQDNVTTLVSMRMTSFPRSPRFVLPARRRPAVRRNLRILTRDRQGVRPSLVRGASTTRSWGRPPLWVARIQGPIAP